MLGKWKLFSFSLLLIANFSLKTFYSLKSIILLGIFFLSIFSSLNLFIVFEISLHFLKLCRSYLNNKTLCTSLSFNDIFLQTTINVVTARKRKKLVVKKMKIVVGNFLHKIEFPKSIEARALSNTLNPNCSYTSRFLFWQI